MLFLFKVFFGRVSQKAVAVVLKTIRR